MPKPKLILDTNVCDKLARSSGLDANRVRKRIAAEFKVVVSPETFIELLDTIKGGKSGEHFKTDQQRLRIMAGSGIPQFLRFPGAFALRTVLGLEAPATKFHPANFRRWFKVVLAAKSRSQLLAARVKLPNDKRLWGINPVTVSDQQKDGKRSHEEWLKKVLTGSYAFPPPAMWAKLIGRDLGLPLTDEQGEVLGERLSAAYEYQKHNFDAASKNPTYNAAKHEGDWVDNQQLYYLCDPTIFLLTDDSGIPQKCAKSGQSKRTLLLKEF